ncbi:hypothetical protein I6F30_03180 [Bradyrhizobium sp. NBAIM20]|uniref:hypothetical protein n=1 Tax=Bradyrhizobium TaxID=374 RepID=UPI001CD375AA|nr:MULTISPECIES: hypothetical protein [unclassified Bradyrhizobium]MCA1410170.1 hypothetical protein [Bradyrhizobium sp. NBAIM20]MCA1462622.1 hypothetical protein [Bradyrhizobium sp. NBAIM18]
MVHLSLPTGFAAVYGLIFYGPSVSGWFRGFRKMVSSRPAGKFHLDGRDGLVWGAVWPPDRLSVIAAEAP